MSNKSPFVSYSNAKNSKEFLVERLKTKFAVSIEHLLDYRGLKRKDLAEQMNVSRPYVSKMLCGDANVTIETLGSLAYELDANISIDLTPKEHMANTWLLLARKDFIAPKYEHLVSSNDSVAFLKDHEEPNYTSPHLWIDRTQDTPKVANG